jgi:hypothetical protein
MRYCRRIACTVVAAVLCHICVNRAARAAGTGDLLYIFDASGSMQGPMEERTKFAIATEILIDKIQELPSDVGVRLIYFGNKIK